jgi:ABC-type branched-subunit amino acid transport system substrate-binding protein
MTLRRIKVAAVVVTAATVVAGCARGSDSEAAAPGGEGVETGVGVTSEPCPEAVDDAKGCIYLGVISDLTVGPFASFGSAVTEANRAFWERVNADGGIGDYEVDVTTFVKDNEYNPEVHRRAYREIEGDILALAQTLGSPTTAAIIEDMDAESVLGVPAGWTSGWAFQDSILVPGANYCYDGMNTVDWMVEEQETASVLAVGYPGDFGDDAAYGASVAAKAHGLEFSSVTTTPGPENQTAAITQIVESAPDLVIVTMGSSDMATIVGESVARGYDGQFVGHSLTWNPGLLDSPAIGALEEHFLGSSMWGPWNAETAGHEAMREALDAEQPSDGYVAGWVLQYPLKAALEAAVENGDLTRTGLIEAARSLSKVDYEDMLPAEAGNFAGGPDERMFRQSVMQAVDLDAPTGMSQVRDFYEGSTAESFELTEPCYTLDPVQ